MEGGRSSVGSLEDRGVLCGGVVGVGCFNVLLEIVAKSAEFCVDLRDLDLRHSQEHSETQGWAEMEEGRGEQGSLEGVARTRFTNDSKGFEGRSWTEGFSDGILRSMGTLGVQPDTRTLNALLDIAGSDSKP